MKQATTTMDAGCPQNRREHAWFAGIDPWLVGGSALYWASIIVQFLVPLNASNPALSFIDHATRYLVLLAFISLGFAFPRMFSTERGRLVLACGTILAAIGAYVLPSGTEFAGGWNLLKLALHMLSVASLMVTWGFAFASMDKRQAGQNVAPAALAATCLVLMFLAVASWIPVELTARLALIASSCVLLTGRIRFSNHRRTKPQETRRPMALFISSRMAFGLFMGFCLETPFRLATSDVSIALLVMGIAALVVAVLTYGVSSEKFYISLPALLFLSVGVTYLPFFEGGLRTAAGAAPALVWLAWAVFSAFQLSDLKERCGMTELSLCLMEKVALSASIICGIIAYRLVDMALPAGFPLDTLYYPLFAGTFACVLGSSNTMAHLVSARKEDEMRATLQQTRHERQKALYDQIASEFGLSAREREVLAMLAEGYTRTYIRETLGISDGTAKAHIAHVYQKLDVHRKDDLLDLVDQRLCEV